MAQKLPVSIEITSESAAAQKDVNKLAGALDNVERNAQKLAAAEGTLNKALASGAITQERHSALLAQATTRWGVHNDAVTKGGISAGQTTQALRQLPAQLTDIFTSLQGGQKPLTVLIQQGGQIKDSFGGIGPAFKQMASLLTVARVAMAGALGVVVAGAMAYKQGSDEVDGYNKALLMNGNAAGTTAGQLDQMAASVDKVVGTQAAAAEVLTQMAGGGQVAAANLEQFTVVALKMERSVGTAVSETVKNFTELGKAPLATTLKLNEAHNYLTAAVYEQIKALQAQGREQEAGEVAQKAFAAAMTSRTQQIEGNLGQIESGWRSLTGAIKEAKDALLDVGRQETPESRLKEATDRVNRFQQQNRRGGNTQSSEVTPRRGYLSNGGLSELDAAKATQAAAQKEVDQAKQAAAAQAQTAKVTEEGIKAEQDNQKIADAALTKKEQYAKKLDAYRQNLAKINAGLSPVSADKVKAQEQAIYEEVYGKGPTAADAAKANAAVEMAKVKANLSLLEDAVKTSDAVIGQALKDGTVTLDAAYGVRLANLQADTDAQREALEADLAEVDKALAKAKTATERAPLLQQRVQIKAQVKLLDSSLTESTRQLSIWKTEQEKQLASITAKVRVEVANITGKFDRSAVEDQLKSQFQGDYQAAGQVTDTAKQEAQVKGIDLLIKTGVAQAEFNAKLSEAQRLQTQLGITEETIRNQATQGAISQTEAEARIAVVRRAQAPVLQDIITKLREMRDALPPDAVVAIDQMNAEIGKLDNTVKAATPTVVDMGKKLENTMIDGLADAAANAVTNFSNLGDAVKSTLKQIAADIVRSGVKKALTDALTPGSGSSGGSSLWSLAVGGVKSLFGFAEGGLIRGAGTGTSDSVPALVGGTTPIAVSNNEFIHPEKAVNHYGLGFMEAVRTLQFPKPKFAFGGLVQAHQRARFATGGQVSSAASAGSAAPNVSIQFVNNGTPQKVTDQSQQFNGKDLIVRVMLADLATNGPIAQGMRATGAR